MATPLREPLFWQAPTAALLLTCENGTKSIFCAFPADKAVVEDADGVVSIENLQFDTNAVKSTNTNGNIQLFPNGTGFTELYGNTNAGTIRFNCESNSHGVTVQGPAHSAAATYTVKLPDTLGLTQASGIVTSDANGVVSFDNGTIDEVTSVTSSSNAPQSTSATAMCLNMILQRMSLTRLATLPHLAEHQRLS